MTGLRTICNARKNELGISSAEIAEQSGLSVSTVRNFLGGSGKSPSIQTVTLICKVLGVSLDDYFGISCNLEMAEPKESQKPSQDYSETIEMLKNGIRTRNRILYIVMIFNLILLVAAVLVHLAYY